MILIPVLIDGLERIFRLLQALVQLLISYPSLFLVVVPPPLSLSLSLSRSSPLIQTLPALRSRLATLRRPFRLFRFLDAFSSAWSTFTSPSAISSSPSPSFKEGLVKWLDIASKSFNGMYLLLESVTFLEALDVPGLGLWGDEVAGVLAVEAQRFWFFSLGCAVVGAGVRLICSGESKEGGEIGGKGKGVNGGKKDGEVDEKGQARGRGKEGREEAVKEKEIRRKIVRRMVADVMDLAVPGSVIGWVPFSAGTVSFLMFWSTILTGLEVWEKCGRELAAAKASSKTGR